MKKRLQNRIAESGITLTFTTVYGIGVWLLCHLAEANLWPQLACFVASTYLMVELSNSNALLRVRNRMVSSTFIMLSCTACFMFSSFSGNVVQLAFIAALLLLSSTYQSPYAVGRLYYGFLCIGVGAMFSVQLLWLVPVLWVLMGVHLQSLSVRGWIASLLGLATPYWFASLWFIFQADFSPLSQHFASLVTSLRPISLETYACLTIHHWLSYGFTFVLAAIGLTHFWHHSYEDKIRIRQLYGFFSILTVLTLLFVLFQPQLFDPLMRLAFVCVSPLVAHFLTLTSTRLTNILFFVITALAIAVTAFYIIMQYLQ